jgi:hypothetical protein
MHVLSLLIGLIIALGLLLLIGPRKTYYVQAPIVAAPIITDDKDEMLEAVGLSLQDRPSSPEPYPERAPLPEPEPSVADMAIQEEDQMPAPEVPEPITPSPAPAPAPVEPF